MERERPDDLYETDIVTWSDQQAGLLRRVAMGERVNEADLDWPNIIEEVETVGRSEVDAVASLLTQAFLHDLKATGWPLAREVPHWRAEARIARAQARRKYRPSMRQKIDLAGLYADALEGLPESMHGQPRMSVPTVCLLSLDEVLAAT
jgi:Domain of unknown function DUF29